LMTLPVLSVQSVTVGLGTTVNVAGVVELDAVNFVASAGVNEALNE